MKDILQLIGVIFFIWIVAVLYSRIAFGQWFWQTWKLKKERDKQFDNEKDRV